MAQDPVVARYAQALMESATESDVVSVVKEQLDLIALSIRKEPQLAQMMRDPGVSPKEKAAVFERGFKGGLNELVKAFVKVVLSLGRSALLAPMADAYNEEVDKAAQRMRVKVRSVSPLPQELLERLKSSLTASEGKEVVLEEESDSELIGGMQVVMDDHRVYDGSVLRQIEEIRQRLKSARVI